MATNKPETPTRYQEIKYRSDQPVRMVGKFTAEHVKMTWKEDFFDKNTKQVITVDRHETIITRGQEISHDMIPKILFHMQAGELKDILVSNQRRMRDQVKRTHPTPFIVNLHMGDRGCKVIVQATSIKQAINIAADWAEQTGEGHFEVVQAKMANDLIIIEDSLRKLEREELTRNADPMDRDKKAEAAAREREEQDENNPENKFYQIDAKINLAGEDPRIVGVSRSFLVRTQDADLAKVLITKWIRKKQEEQNKESDKIGIVLEEAKIFTCNKVIPYAFTTEYLKHEREEEIIEEQIRMTNLPSLQEQIKNSLEGRK